MINEMKYWGKRAAGCIFFCPKTNRMLLNYRSAEVMEPNLCYSTWGGKFDGNESVEQVIEREVVEESGYIGNYDMEFVYTFVDGNFKYYNFLVIVDNEFEPILNWETEIPEGYDEYPWFDFNDCPDNLHLGLKRAWPYFYNTIKVKGVL